MRLIILLSLLCFPVALIGQTDFDNAVEYNAFIVQEQHEVVKKNLEYISFSIHHDDYQLIEAKRKAVLKQISQARARIAGMPAFKGNNRLKKEATAVLVEYQGAFEDDFKKAIELGKKSKDSFEAMEAYFKAQDKSEDRVTKAMQRFNKVQEQFVTQHNLTFGAAEVQDDLTLKMRQIAALNQYVRRVFLEYFSVSKAFTKMLSVLQTQKSKLLETERKQVIRQAEKAIPVLRNYGAFNGEDEYLNQTVKVIAYYRDLAKNEFLEVSTILGKQPQIDQQDIAYINKVLRDYNNTATVLIKDLSTANNNLLQNNIAVIE